MNRELISFDRAVGKTIEHIIESKSCYELLIAFTDNTFATILAESGYEESLDLYWTKPQFDRRDYSISQLAIVFDEATVAAWQAEDDARTKQQKDYADKMEFQRYQELKKKFESDS